LEYDMKEPRAATTWDAVVARGACDPLPPPDDEPDYITGLQGGCLVAGGLFDAETKECLPAPPAPEPAEWLMVQDAEAVTFEFDPEVSAECPEEAFWSGAMTMTDADPDTLWFTDRPDRLAYTQSTDASVDGFEQTFSEATGSYPTAVLNWREWDVDEEIPVPGVERHIVVELTSPAYSQEDATLTYAVCGLRLDDPGTLEPLPDAEQYQPEEAPSSGDFALFIDGVTKPVCGASEAESSCYLWGYCGSGGGNSGSCSGKGLANADWGTVAGACEKQFGEGVGYLEAWRSTTEVASEGQCL
jgi:hypothetical protein